MYSNLELHCTVYYSLSSFFFKFIAFREGGREEGESEKERNTDGEGRVL